MRMEAISLIGWQNRFGSEEACVEALEKVRWPGGFICPECAWTEYSYITSRQVYQCCHCHHQTSVTSGTIFHSTNLPLVKWFWSIYLSASDKGGISALRLSKHMMSLGEPLTGSFTKFGRSWRIGTAFIGLKG